MPVYIFYNDVIFNARANFLSTFFFSVEKKMKKPKFAREKEISLASENVVMQI